MSTKFVPPSARSRAALGLTAAATRGRFELQVCQRCSAVQYPPREACHRCLDSNLAWQLQSGDGELLATTRLFHSQLGYFRERLPWRVGMVRLDCGPTVIAHLHGALTSAPARVKVDTRLDESGQAVLIALPHGAVSSEDKLMQEMSCDPRGREILVTDGRSPLGRSLAQALVAAGARTVWVGDSNPEERWTQIDGAQIVALDVTDSGSVAAVAGHLSTRVEILVNNAEFAGPTTAADLGLARRQMEVNYFGLVNLAREFAPTMRARESALAWVNLLSIYALAGHPAHVGLSASKAAAWSLSQGLRAQLQPAGIRVVNVFPGPVDDELNRFLTVPKIGVDTLAREIVRALQQGQEDVYPGDLAQEWLARWRADPKVLERELWGAGG